MSKLVRNDGSVLRSAAAGRYDAHHTVLAKTYGALADLRRELADSKAAVAERTEILNLFANCTDSQRAWLLLEDYFEKLSLARKDFPGQDWWPRLLQARGKQRLEATALLFLQSGRALPTELAPHANLERLHEIEAAEKERHFVDLLEQWLLPPRTVHLDSPRAGLRVLCELQRLEGTALHCLKVQFGISRPRTGEKIRTLAEIVEVAGRSTHEEEVFAPSDWQFIQWLVGRYGESQELPDPLLLSGIELLQWLARWGQSGRFESVDRRSLLHFHGQMAEFAPALTGTGDTLAFGHRLKLAKGDTVELRDAQFVDGDPSLVLVGDTFYLVRNPPPKPLLNTWLESPSLPISKLSHRLLKQLRKTEPSESSPWRQLCVAHLARPQFTFELEDDTVRLRLLARSELDQSVWQWNGDEWQPTSSSAVQKDKPDILDDPRLEPAMVWLRRLDWFTPEPGLWIGDANENFLQSLAVAWPDRPSGAEYLGNPAFHRLFLAPRRLRPKLMVQGSGIDWFSVCAAWEAEGLKLTPADLERLQTATGRFVKLPDGGWMELDCAAVQSAHEAMADLGLDCLSPVPQRVSLLHAAQSQETTLQRFADQPHAKSLRQRLAEFTGIPPAPLPAGLRAEMRPYQKDGFDFLCHLTGLKLGGVLADDMGLGKTLQTLAWLAWCKDQNIKKPKPSLVICPASVLHNWQREANRFTPGLRVLVLESGAARHNLRQQIPEHDIIVTNYALLRRDLNALQKFEFRAIILDEAQFIKNPNAQVTQSVKQLRAEQRLALTGTPLENRLLDLWSIVDFVQPTYLGTQTSFTENYEPKGPDASWAQQVARRRLAAKLRPLLLRRLKRQVAQDLPDRIEERRDCELGEAQRKLYLAELRRSREQVQQAVNERGLARSKIHVLAALTRLRQICCHPQLVGNDSPSGKTETLFELLDALIAEGQKVLVFSQFVQMLKLLEVECQQRQFRTYILTGESKQRQEIVSAFQNEPNASIFLLSLRAAGTGLNLTTASYVVLYDPWWNPAVEAQAIDRSHRIGQTRTVNAYRLIAPGTVEEKIWELQQRKAQTISDVLGEEGFARSLSKTDLEYLFSED
jgi:hypothetical protein